MHLLASTQTPLITPTIGQLSGIHLFNKTILYDQLKLHMSKIHHLQQLHVTTIHSFSTRILMCMVDYATNKFIHAPMYITMRSCV